MIHKFIIAVRFDRHSKFLARSSFTISMASSDISSWRFCGTIIVNPFLDQIYLGVIAPSVVKSYIFHIPSAFYDGANSLDNIHYGIMGRVYQRIRSYQHL